MKKKSGQSLEEATFNSCSFSARHGWLGRGRPPSPQIRITYVEMFSCRSGVRGPRGTG